MENQINLKVLGIQFESENYCFRDDGFVDDVHKHAEEIYQEFGDDPRDYSLKLALLEGKIPVVSGITMKNDTFTPIKIISFCQHCEPPLKETFVKGHEETHALQEMQGLHLLQERLTALGLNIDVGFYSDKELIADIGGLYAVIKYGFSPLLITPFLDKEGKDKILEFYLEFLGSKNSVQKVTSN